MILAYLPPSAARTLSWPYRGLSAPTFSRRVYPPPLLSLSPARSTLYLDTASPPASPSSRVSSLPLLPRQPAIVFYFSFIFPTREPSRCNLHPSCCCCRRPSRLPRATTGVEASSDSPTGEIVVGVEFGGKFCNNFNLFALQRVREGNMAY